ncbi:uncharacterized protein LOC109838986 [Asparagus officinalis]|uniref:uncharacterized protein LOC109838986 n=1 Tax=Asparagus officinalis TaxID=4686 RepID=UPI00098E4403|nr:uncharacterized protein LOC109838986 [Asparagus officinalis]
MEYSLSALLVQNNDAGHEQEPCTNNVAEYNALLIRLKLARELEIKHLEAYADSQLIVKQMMGEYEVRNEDLIQLQKASTKLVKSFESFRIEHVLHSRNTHADALASLAANLAQPLETTQCVPMVSRRLFRPEDVLDMNATHQVSDQPDPKDWHLLIIDYVLYGMLPEDAMEQESVRRRASRFYYDSTTKTLYRKSYDGLLLLCLSKTEA